MGGIGPTHDDVTMKAVALALYRPLLHSPAMETLLVQRSAELRENAPLQSLPDAHASRDIQWDVSNMCLLPQGTELVYRPGEEAHGYPLLRCSNVYMLPGVPRYCREQLELVGQVLAAQSIPRTLFTRQVRCSLLEPFLATAVTAVARRFADSVDIGSYPYVSSPQSNDALERDVKTIITAEGHDVKQVEEAVALLLESVPPHSILSIERHSTLPTQ